ncbi:IclR family transcriptional regulator [Falsigemmobacter faecalis]|uniref:IclR family transcriptional regulator n=1 Tax=Falsigemmobacter faecalis TaxID=2488730 RepID=A0A3P3D1Q1_9RHOB|nr:IclR family transcriptional regulator [Falsigemmobacter faecalis]RRH68375.1 IclR family transcriptional regulator [Falsigemmobacter faecalis]
MPSYEPINALVRGLTVLEVMSTQEAFSVKELHARTGMPKPSLIRILETLIATGYISASGDPLRYRLSPRCLLLSSGVNRVSVLVDRITPLLSRFQSEIRWPSDVAVFDRDAMVIAATTRRPGMLSINRQVGSRVPVATTGVGRAYLAFLPEPQLMESLQTLRELTATPADVNGFMDILAQVRVRGYSVSDQEHHPRVRTIAAPIFDEGGVVAAINIIALSEVITIAELEDQYGSQLTELAKEMSVRPGCSG